MTSRLANVYGDAYRTQPGLIILYAGDIKTADGATGASGLDMRLKGKSIRCGKQVVPAGKQAQINSVMYLSINNDQNQLTGNQ